MEIMQLHLCFILIPIVLCANKETATLLEAPSTNELNKFIQNNNPFFWLAEHTRRRIQYSEKDCASCTCGTLNGKTRIVGGRTTEENKYPWAVQLLMRGNFGCGGSLINNLYVLTAAHCVRGVPVNRLRVRLLNHRRSIIARSSIQRRISKAIVYDGYSPQTLTGDIALLKMEKPVAMTNVLRPVCLVSGTDSYAGQNGIIIGWGKLGESKDIAETLQEVTVPIITNTQCRRNQPYVTDSMLCAGFESGEKDSCYGDSGGPLHINDGDVYYQAGVVSFGIGCARRNMPGVYTRISKYYDWIVSNTRDACYCKNY